MQKFIQALLVALAVVCSFVPASAGTYEDKVFRPGEPRWGSSSRHWEDRNVRPQHRHGNVVQRRGNARGGQRQIVPEPYIYTKSRTCARWVQRGGVGPKIVIGTYAC